MEHNSGGTVTTWTQEENKKFEIALASMDESNPYRWLQVASLIPGKSVHDVMNRYSVLVADVSNIENDLIPIPGYLSSSKRARTNDHERKKGVPWTQDEHRRFLLGLEKHGKGDWRSISRNYVISKTPTQVASHAQKYYLRQNSGVKDRRRPSIHDITIINPSTDPSNNLAQNPSKLETEWDQNIAGQLVVLDSADYPNELIALSQSILMNGTEGFGFPGFQS